MWCIHSSFTPHLYDICDLIFILAYVSAPKPPILHQHIDCICNYIIELGMLVPPNHFFWITYKLNLLVMQTQFNSIILWYKKNFNPYRIIGLKMQYKYLDYFG